MGKIILLLGVIYAFLVGLYVVFKMDGLFDDIMLERTDNLSLDGTARKQREQDMRKEERKKLYDQLKISMKDIVISALILGIETALGLLFWTLGFTEANIITVYILGSMIIAILTSSRSISLIVSVLSVILFNFLFTAPRFTLMAHEYGYPITFAVMFVATLITGTLAHRVKDSAQQREEAALLAQKEQFRANLLRSVSHDIRTPLTSISGNAGVLISNSRGMQEEKKEEIYQSIYDDSIWLIKLVENMLSITRMEDGKLNIKTNPELVEEIVSEALHQLNRYCENHHVINEVADDMTMVKVDARLIVQVLINLIDNAVKYTPEGSTIMIRSQKIEHMVKISVVDNGPGIRDELKPHVFEMFNNINNSIADSKRSLGLGLALCKSIVNAHGGEMELEDNQPTGCIFSFTLPTEEVHLNE